VSDAGVGPSVNSAVFALVERAAAACLSDRRVSFIWQTLPKLGVPEVRDAFD